MSRKRGKSKRETAVPVSSIRFDRFPFYGVLFLVFAIPLFIWPGISEYGYGKTMVTLIGVSALAILWGLSALRERTWTIRLPWIAIPILGLIVASLLSLLSATSGRVVIQSLVLVVFFALFMLIIANAVRDARDVTLLLSALLLSAFLAALYGMLQYLGVMRGPAGSGALVQVISTMGNRNYLGGFLTYLLFPSVVLVVRPRSRWVRLAAIALIAFCFGMILTVRQTGTAVALALSAVTFLAGIAVFRPIEPIRRARRWLLILLGALVVTFLVEAPSGPLNSVVGLSASGAAEELLLNPSFEGGPSHWGANGARAETGGIDSLAWWKIERDGRNRGCWQLDADGAQRMIPIQSGQGFVAGGSLLSNGRTTAQMRVLLLDAEQERIKWKVVGRTTSTSWTAVETAFTAPREARYISVQLLAAGADGWAGFDEFYLRPIGALESWARQLWARNAGGVRSWDWWVGWEMFKDYPVTGIGLGNYKLNFLPYKAEFLASPRGEDFDFYIDRAAQAHNEYVQVLAEMGILGTLALLSFLALLVVTIWMRLRASDETCRLDLLLFGCGILTFVAHALVSFPAHLPSSTLVLVVTGGLIFSRAYGDSAQFRVKLTGAKLKVTVACIAVLGVLVSVVAGRDLAANLLMSEGIEQAQLGNVYGAETLFERSLALDFAPRQTYYHLATVQIERGAYDEALANLEKCFARFIDEAVYLNYANLMANKEQYDQAREVTALLLATRPREDIAVRARYIEAVIVAQTGSPIEATALLEALVEDAPWFETGYIGLGSIYQARGMPAEAREAFEAALARIERKINRAEEDLASREMITAEEYGKLRTDLEHFQQERQTVLDRLEELQGSEAP